MRRDHGFTLIELLVVVGVIGILMSLLLPQLKEVRDKAMQAKCGSNYRQMGQAFYAYAGDNDGRLFPLFANGTGGSFSNRFWYYNGWPYSDQDLNENSSSLGTPCGVATLLANYITDFRIWSCPKVERPAPIDAKVVSGGTLTLANTSPACASTTWLFFVYNTSLPHYQEGTVTRYGFGAAGFPRVMSQARPSLPMAQDGYSMTNSPNANDWIICHSRNSYAGVGNGLGQYCNFSRETDGQGTTILFYDGSVRFVPRNELVRVDCNWVTGQIDPNVTTKSVLP